MSRTPRRSDANTTALAEMIATASLCGLCRPSLVMRESVGWARYERVVLYRLLGSLLAMPPVSVCPVHGVWSWTSRRGCRLRHGRFVGLELVELVLHACDEGFAAALVQRHAEHHPAQHEIGVLVVADPYA